MPRRYVYFSFLGIVQYGYPFLWQKQWNMSNKSITQLNVITCIHTMDTIYRLYHVRSNRICLIYSIQVSDISCIHTMDILNYFWSNWICLTYIAFNWVTSCVYTMDILNYVWPNGIIEWCLVYIPRISWIMFLFNGISNDKYWKGVMSHEYTMDIIYYAWSHGVSLKYTIQSK